MKEIIDALGISVKHIDIMDDVFSSFNYPERTEYLRMQSIITDLISSNKPFTYALYYGDDGRQMILSDIFEYIFNGRGYYYMWNPSEPDSKKIFFKIVLYFINQLMILESISVDRTLRNALLDKLRETLGDASFFLNDESQRIFNGLKSFEGDVHFDTSDSNVVPANIIELIQLKDSTAALKRFDNYTDSLLPKLPHGLWRELIVYIQLLRINAGYILPLLLNQRIVSRDHFLKPPDFLVIKDDGSLIGVEVGGGKEAQSSNFSTKMKCQMVTAENTNIPPRCPICGKWVLFCDKVIEEFVDLSNPLLYIDEDIRCAHDCNIYSYEQVMRGECPHIKYRGQINPATRPKQKIKFKNAYHYHYACILRSQDTIALNEIERQKSRWENHLNNRGGAINNTTRSMTINCLKTNYPYFGGISNLANYSKGSMKCYSQFLNNKNCVLCIHKGDCETLSKLKRIINTPDVQNSAEIVDQITSLFT